LNIESGGKVRKLFYFVIVLMFIFVLSNCTEESTSEKTEDSKKIPQTLDELKTRIDSIFEDTNIPGAAVAIVSADSVVWIGTFGFANLETKEQVTENTHFCVGSCTKSFTGLGFLTLLDDGRIDLNTPVCEIAPEIRIDNPWKDTDPVRIVHLLEHTAGFDDSHPNWFYFEKPIISLKEALEAKTHLRKVRWKPGTRFSYSSPAFTLAGYVLEKISHQRYEDYMKNNILKPIGMETSTIGSSEDCRRLLAVGYGRDNEPFPVWYDYDEPAGALNSSIKEMALFIRFMLSRGAVDNKQVVSKALFDKIGKPETSIAARAGLHSGYSFGIGTRFRNGAKWYSHSGAVPGFIAEYAYNLDHGLGFVVLQNSFDLSFYDDVFSVVRDYIDTLVEPAAPPPPVSLSTSQINSYCGYYEPRNPRIRIMEFGELLSGGVTISCENDTLFSRGFMGTKQSYVPVSENLFRRPEDPEATAVFTETSDGKMALATRSLYYERTAKWIPVVYRILVFSALIIMMSAIVYSLFWIPVHLYKKLKRKENRSKYIRMRLIPLFAVLSLVSGLLTFFVAEPSILELGQKTPANVEFFISTLLFAGLSALSLFTSFKSFFKPVKKLARIYAIILSSACFGMALYLYYWGIIGLRLWAY
jgi:CubicO group peptidase (beta-lactamase class C family)